MKAIFIFVFVLMFGIAGYFFFSTHPHLTGVSQSGTWKISYKHHERFWDGKLTKMSKEKTTLQQFIWIENDEKQDYSPSKYEETNSSFDFKWMGDRPNKDVTYVVKLSWKDKKGKHIEEISMVRSYNPFN